MELGRVKGGCMETINCLELRDETIYPDENILSVVLEESFTSYTKLLDLFSIKEMSCEWRYYQDGKAWLCKVQKKKRTIVWMSAWKGFMQVTVYLPVRMLDEIKNLELSELVIDKILNTKNVGKSKPCIFEIKDSSTFNDLEKVMDLKIKNR